MEHVAATSPTVERENNRPAVRAASRTERLRGFLECNVFVVCMLAACCVVEVSVARATIGPDGWYSLIGGRMVLHHGIPRHDTLTYLTLGHKWVNQQWLGQLILYALWAAGRWPLALVGLVVVSTAAFAVAAAGARSRGASDRSTALILLAAFITGFTNTAFRAQTLSYVLFSIVLALLLRDDRRKSRAVYLVFPVLIIWANIHGSVISGAAAVSLLGVVEAVRALRARSPFGAWAPRSAALVILPWLCTLASPYGLALPGYYKSILDNPTLANFISEWGPSTLRAEPVFFVVLLGGIWLAAHSRGALTMFSKLVLLGTAVAGLDAGRNEVWFALVVAAVLPAALDDLWPTKPARRRASLNAILASAAVVVVIGALIALASHRGAWYDDALPPKGLAAVARAAAANPSMKIFSNEQFADWLLFKVPSLSGRVAYDVRFELLSKQQLKKIVAFRQEHGLNWQRGANGYRLLVLGTDSDKGAIQLYKRMPGTKILYRDSSMTVLQRASP